MSAVKWRRAVLSVAREIYRCAPPKPTADLPSDQFVLQMRAYNAKIAELADRLRVVTGCLINSENPPVAADAYQQHKPAKRGRRG